MGLGLEAARDYDFFTSCCRCVGLSFAFEINISYS
jgi:hypothetical protein